MIKQLSSKGLKSFAQPRLDLAVACYHSFLMHMCQILFASNNTAMSQARTIRHSAAPPLSSGFN